MQDKPDNVEDITISGNYTLTENMVCDNLYLSTGTLDLNGYTCVVYEDLNQTGGTLAVSEGILTVMGDYSLGTEEERTNTYLKMINADDYVYVGGDMLMHSAYSHTYYLTNGILELKGNFKQLSVGVSNLSNFNCIGNYSVILSGEGTHTLKLFVC